MGEFEFEMDWESMTHDDVEKQVWQRLAERGIHKDRFSDYSVKVLVTVYYDIRR